MELLLASHQCEHRIRPGALRKESKPITKQKDKQEAHGEENPKEWDKNKHVALGRKQTAKINCIVSLAQFFLFCYETGFVFIIEEKDIFQGKNLSWIDVMAKVHFMGRFE